MTEDLAEQIARLDERDTHILQRLDSIDSGQHELRQELRRSREDYSDLRARVAGWSAGVSILVSIAIGFAARADVPDMVSTIF